MLSSKLIIIYFLTFLNKYMYNILYIQVTLKSRNIISNIKFDDCKMKKKQKFSKIYENGFKTKYL